MKSVRVTKPERMAAFLPLGGVATDLWFDKKRFSLWAKLKAAFKKTGV